MNKERQEPAKSRLVVDEDWKARVGAEKEAAKAAAEGGTTAESTAPDDTSATGQSDAAAQSKPHSDAATQSKSQSEAATRSKRPSAARKAEKTPPLPPASFVLLVTSLATQAMALLGEAESPSKDPNDPEADPKILSASALELARHAIDTLGMLEEKTRGNLVREESAVLSSTLHELRMTYVAIRDGKQAQSL